MRAAMSLSLLLVGCAATPKVAAPSGLVLASAGSAKPVVHRSDVPDIHEATYETKFYTHETIDPDNDIPTTGGILRVRAPLEKSIHTLLTSEKTLRLDSDATVVVADEHGSTRDIYVRIKTVVPDYWVWTVVRFEIAQTPNGFSYLGRQVDGNLDDLRIGWWLASDGNETLARFELMGDPSMPLPRSWIMRDTRKGVRDVLERFRHALEDHFTIQCDPPEPRIVE